MEKKVKAKIRRNKIIIGMLVICFLIIGYGAVKEFYQRTAAAFRVTEMERIDISKDIKGGIPRFYQTDDRWSSKKYGSNTMEISGCGPTCLSMVYCGLTGDGKWNPYAIAYMSENNGYYVPGSGTSWTLMTEGARKLGLEVEEIPLSENLIRDKLRAGYPIICAMGPGDFTTEGHFIVLTGVDSEGKIILNDPNSEKLSEKTWELTHLMSQMKNLWWYTD